MVRYTIDSYTVQKEIGEVTGMVTLTDHLNAESASQAFKVESLDGNVIHTQLVAMALKFDADNIAAAAANDLPDTIDGVDAGTEVQFDDDGSSGEGIVTGIVWVDADNDGVQNDVDRIVGATVELLMAVDDSVVGTTTTDANGIYTFENVENSAYKVRFTIEDGYEFSPQNQGGDDELDSDANASTGVTSSFVLSPDATVANIDCGMHLIPLGSIAGIVWNDTDHDGIRDGGETSGILGATVELHLVSDDSLVDSVNTGAPGTYIFEDIVPDDYYVQFGAISNYVLSPQNQGADDTLDSDPNVGNGQTGTITVGPGDNITNVDCGMYYNLAHITGSIFDDWDRDGTWDSPDETLSAISTLVEVCYTVNDVVANSVTTTSGAYDLTVVPGDYYVKMTPTTYWEISPLAGDNEFDPTTRKSEDFTVDSGDTVTYDVGIMHERGYVDAHVFADDGAGGGTPDDGIQNGTEIDWLTGGGVYLRVTNPQGGFWDSYPSIIDGNIHLLVHTGINLTAAWMFVDAYATGYHITGAASNPETGITVTKGGTTDLGDRGVAAD